MPMERGADARGVRHRGSVLRVLVRSYVSLVVPYGQPLYCLIYDILAYQVVSAAILQLPCMPCGWLMTCVCKPSMCSASAIVSQVRMW